MRSVVGRRNVVLVAAALLSMLVAASAFAEDLRLVQSTPTDGDVNVSPEIGRLVLTFSRPMNAATYSVMEVRGETVPPLAPVVAPWESPTTFVLKLKSMRPNTDYALLLNSEFQTGFKSADGKPLRPHRIAFRTGGRPAEGPSPAQPGLVRSSPADGAGDVPTDVGRIEFVFDKPMRTSTVSVTPAEAGVFPPLSETVDLAKFWRDPVTFVLPVTALAPRTDYAIRLNGGLYTGFQSAGEIALPAMTVRFRTSGDSGTR